MNEGFTSSELLLLDTDDLVDMGLSEAAAKRFKESNDMINVSDYH